MSTTRYERGQRVRFIRDASMTFPKGRPDDTDPAWEAGVYVGVRTWGGWHTVRSESGGETFGIPSRRLRPVKGVGRRQALMNEAWAKFLAGHWQKEMPHAVGEFPRAGQDGLRAMDAAVRFSPNRQCWWSPHDPGEDWAGWWWSEPIPDLPPPPPWETP